MRLTQTGACIKMDAIRRAGYLAREDCNEAGPRTRITSYVPRKRK